MANRKNNQLRAAGAAPRPRRKLVLMAAALSCALIATGTLAQWRLLRVSPAVNPATTTATTPAAPDSSMAAANPAKEYIYAGGRLLATEESATASAPCTPASAVKVMISEFRFRGTRGASDEFIELYNSTNSPITVCASDGTTGWSIAARSSDGSSVSPQFIIPNGTTIPARGHYLAINSNGYSLGTNANDANFSTPPPPGFSIDPQQEIRNVDPKNWWWITDKLNMLSEVGNTLLDNTSASVNSNVVSAGAVLAAATSLTRLTANGDRQYTVDISDSTGVALFTTTNPVNFTQDYRLDAVGFSSMGGSNAGTFREGAGLAPIGSGDGEYSFVRKQTSGYPQDTNDNAADFMFISTSGGAFGGVQSVLGAPGPENLSSPVNRNVSTIFDPGVASSSAPNREFCSSCTGANARHGTMTFRRTFTNNTDQALTHLRFRIIDITTLYSPGYTPGGRQADLRALSSTEVMVTRSDGSRVSVKGTVVETPPGQPLGGGLNTSLVVPLTNSRLAAGESIHAQFALGIEQHGSYRFILIVEALP